MLSEIEKIASSKQYEFINVSISENIVDNNRINVVIKIIKAVIHKGVPEI